MKQLLYVCLAVSLLLLPGPTAASQPADATYQALPFTQDWTNTGLITTSDDWSGVPGVVGYRGDDLTLTSGVDPQTILADGAATPVDVNANQTDPNTFTAGGVTEFELANPVIALNGSGTADAPFIVLHLNTTGFGAIQVAYNLRDLDGSADDAGQQVALHYRVGAAGDFTNVASAYVADATTGGAATQVTPVNITLPAAAENQPQLQVRIMTTNAPGNDEWVGVDDIAVTGTPIAGDTAPSVSATVPASSATNVPAQTDIVVTFSEPVALLGTWLDITCTVSGSHAAGVVSGGATVFTFNPATDFAVAENCTGTVFAGQVRDVDTDDPPDHLAADYVWSFTTAGPPCVAADTPIGLIQGAGAAFDPAYGGTQTVQGVVVGDYEGPSPALRGFYVQNLDTEDDDNPATSDALFVFEGDNADRVSAGQVVQVTGNVSEYQDQTQISAHDRGGLPRGCPAGFAGDPDHPALRQRRLPGAL